MNEIPLSGGDYNGGTLKTVAGTVRVGDYVAIEGHPTLPVQYYLVHTNGVARHDPDFTGRGALMFVAGEVDM